MAHNDNRDILSWKRVIQNLQDRTDEGINEYNELGIPQDEELINKVATWIYHESDNPISEIEHLLTKSGAVGDYEDAMEEGVKEETVTEGTWSIPDTPEKVRELKDLMKQELPADEAQDKIYGILGDDELFDDIAEMEEKDPKADVRGMIVRRLDDLGLIKKKVNETTEALTEEQFDEAAGEKDACYHKVKARYKIWPSAYASGALTQCRKKGAKNWGNSKK